MHQYTVDPSAQKTVGRAVTTLTLIEPSGPLILGAAVYFAGSLTVMLGSDPATLPAVLPILQMYAKKVIHTGKIGEKSQPYFRSTDSLLCSV